MSPYLSIYFLNILLYPICSFQVISIVVMVIEMTDVANIIPNSTLSSLQFIQVFFILVLDSSVGNNYCFRLFGFVLFLPLCLFAF